MRTGITILMYHRVLEDDDCTDYPFPSLVMPRSLFEAQLDYLREHTHVLPVSEALGDDVRGSKPLVCLTFDDGYADNFEIAAPLLEERGLRGTFFITAGAVEAREPLWYDLAADIWNALGGSEVGRLASEAGNTHVPAFGTRESWIEWLKAAPNDRRHSIMRLRTARLDDSVSPCPLMTADQVRRLSESGHEIGSHTLWHPILTTMAENERRDEIEGARKLLQVWTGRDVTGFCYPNGNFDAGVVHQLREAGHSYACSTRPGRNHEGTDPFQLRRIDVKPDGVASADGSFDALGFRAEISLAREGLRRWTKLRGWRSA
jgi:peptidoglycan/xylan/chitin deacetylase (PgdA/CDA1 family)